MTEESKESFFILEKSGEKTYAVSEVRAKMESDGTWLFYYVSGYRQSMSGSKPKVIFMFQIRHPDMKLYEIDFRTLMRARFCSEKDLIGNVLKEVRT